MPYPTDLPKAGTVFLGTVQLDIDPETYSPLRARRRGSVHRLIDGSTVLQDRGVNAADRTVTLQGKLYNLTTVQDLQDLYETVGETFTYTDWLGNEFTCVFTPGTESLVLTPVRGQQRGWDYQINLSVLSAAQTLPTPT
jgi:hypothetical protein